MFLLVLFSDDECTSVRSMSCELLAELLNAFRDSISLTSLRDEVDGGVKEKKEVTFERSFERTWSPTPLFRLTAV